MASQLKVREQELAGGGRLGLAGGSHRAPPALRPPCSGPAATPSLADDRPLPTGGASPPGPRQTSTGPSTYSSPPGSPGTTRPPRGPPHWCSRRTPAPPSDSSPGRAPSLGGADGVCAFAYTWAPTW